MASAVDSRLAYARLSAVATASRLPTATRGSNNSYTTSWDTTGQCVSGVGRYEGQPILITEAKVRRRGYWYRFRGRNDQHAERADE